MTHIVERLRAAYRGNTDAERRDLLLKAADVIESLWAQVREAAVKQSMTDVPPLVRSLEWFPWTDNPTPCAEAMSSVGLYRITPYGATARFLVGLNNGECTAYFLDEAGERELTFQTIEEAKAEAQRDYEQRILRGLSGSPIPYAWQPIATAPKNPAGKFYGPNVLVYSPGGVCVYKAYFGPGGPDGVGAFCAFEDGDEIDDVTHWLPLPAAPTDARDE